MSRKISQSGINIVAAINGLAAILHIVFWGLVFLRLPSPWSVSEIVAKNDLIVTYGLGLADLLWSVPTLAVGSLLLRKRRFSGWLAAQMANVLWWYSFTFILFREISEMHIRPGTILFLPFALFSIWSAWYLWQAKSLFIMKGEIL